MKLYVGNMSFQTTEQQLRELFEPYGVTSASVVTDRESGRPRGFGFVEVSSNEFGQAAITALHGKNIDGRDLTVNEATQRGGGSSGGGNRGAYGHNKGRGGW
ncbi:MAG: RNA-binding protein [Phycisphaeraceae bacterium]|nr:RNA-binding protein [Phycisphaerales bacterium]MCB9861245.1 RNA-binding protein [Phycisphaeraceae bacterium]